MHLCTIVQNLYYGMYYSHDVLRVNTIYYRLEEEVFLKVDSLPKNVTSVEHFLSR